MNPSAPKNTKARSALVRAFRELVLSRPYDEIHVPLIISHADVSRSTFYEHFRNKDDILRNSLKGVLGLLATAGFHDGKAEDLERVLQHIQEFAPLTTVYLSTPVSSIVVKLLAELIEERITEDRTAITETISVSLAASQVAESSLGLIRAWIDESYQTSAKSLANHLDRSARALLATFD